MPKIGQQKKDKIQEQILFFLYDKFPNPQFSSDIARETARDEEFIKTLMFELLKKELLIKINKNPKGIQYSRRLRWRLSNKAHDIYSKHQKTTQNQLRYTKE